MKTSAELDKLAPALVALQAELQPVVKANKNDFIGNKYADLTAVWAALNPLLEKHRLTVIQGCDMDICAEVQTCVTRIIHESGQWIETGTMAVVPKREQTKKGDFPAGPQQFMAAFTYARRYMLMAAFNMPTTDDDGETAQGRGRSAPKGPPGDGNGPPVVPPPTVGERINATMKEKGLKPEDVLEFARPLLELPDLDTLKGLNNDQLERLANGLEGI